MMNCFDLRRRCGAQVATLCATAALLLFASGCHRPAPPGAVGAAAKPAAIFEDVAQQAGIRYTWTIAGKRPLNILQTIGNGCAFLDYDNDGNLDVLLVGPTLALYRGDGHGHFTDVTHATGLDALKGNFLGCAVGDYDNDGYDDIYLTAYRGGALLHNEGGKRLRNVTAEAGIRPQPWGTSAGFVETSPGSGRLDLYICNYADFGPTTQPQLCTENNLPTSCGPRHYRPIHGVFYRNLGNGRFRDATAAAGMDQVSGRALGVAFASLEPGMPPAIAIANDEMPGDLLVPRKSQPVKSSSVTSKPTSASRTSKAPELTSYKNAATLSGTAYDRDGSIHGGMGADWGDYDNNGRFDLFVATFQGEAKSLYHNDGSLSFVDTSTSAGIGAPTTPFVAFGCRFLDYDNDGWLDIAIANGHVQDNIQAIDRSAKYLQGAQLFHNRGGMPATFEEVSQLAGAGFGKPIVGRGLAIGDFDNDGRVDVMIVNAEGAPLLLHNNCPNAGNWLELRLEGTRSNRDGLGAIVTAQVGDRTLMRQCQTAGSYMSASDRRVHLGLGSATKIDRLTIAWPSGMTTTLTDVPCNRCLGVREGERQMARSTVRGS